MIFFLKNESFIYNKMSETLIVMMFKNNSKNTYFQNMNINHNYKSGQLLKWCNINN